MDAVITACDASTPRVANQLLKTPDNCGVLEIALLKISNLLCILHCGRTKLLIKSFVVSPTGPRSDAGGNYVMILATSTGEDGLQVVTEKWGCLLHLPFWC